MLRLRTRPWKALSFASIVVLPACADDLGPRRTLPLLEVGPDGDLLVADRAFLLEGRGRGEIEVMEDALALSPETVAPQGSWQVDDLLVSGEGAGFLRRVVDVEEHDDEIFMVTERASLADLVAYGGVHTSMKPFSEGLRLDEGSSLGGLSGRSAGLGAGDLRAPMGVHAADGVGLDYQFPPTVLVDAGAIELRLEGGHFTFDPTLDVDLDLGFFQVDRFEVLARGDVDAEIELALVTELSEEVHETMQLWQSPPYVWYAQLGPVPVVIATQLTLDATVDVAVTGPSSVSMTAGAGGFAELGAVFQDGWTGSADQGFEVRLTGPELKIDSELDAKVRLDGTLEVKLYEVIAPSLTLSPWTGVHVDDSLLTVDVGLDAAAGGKIGSYPLDIQLLDWEHRVVDQPL